MGAYERDYLERTIATVRNHRDADNCWPQWANIFADEIERLWAAEAWATPSEVVCLRGIANLLLGVQMLPEQPLAIQTAIAAARAWAAADPPSEEEAHG